MSSGGKKSAKSKSVKKFFPTSAVDAQSICGIHHAVPEWLLKNSIYGTNDLGYITKSGTEVSLRDHPIGITPRDENGNHHVVSGFRSWHILKSAEMRQLITIQRPTITVYPEATNDERIKKIAMSSVLLDLELRSVSPQNAHAQIAEILTHLDDETWVELFGTRERPSPSIKSAPQAITDSNQLPKGRGRPRTRPLKDPNAPKRPRGRPKKNGSPEHIEVDDTPSSVDTDSADIEH